MFRRPPSLARLLALLCLAAALAGCGYVGEPMPPALDIPIAVTDLTALQRGSEILVSFTIPPRTTEGFEVEGLRDVDLRVGPGGKPPFQVDRWSATARKVNLDVSSGGPVTAEVPVDGLAGQEVFFSVRMQGSKGRWSGWSNIVTLQVVPAVAAPMALKAESSGAGVHLTWQGAGRFRIFRKDPKDEEYTRIGVSETPEYTDSTAEYGKTYEYSVQSAVKAGSSEAESDPTPGFTITPVDTFPPAVPAGLAVLAGSGSVELSWDRNTETDLGGYFVYRTEAGGAFTRLGGRIDAPSYSDRTVQSGKRYQYRVTSVDLKGNESAPSGSVEIVAP